MGLIRKSLSVGTFGFVAFRSKKEKLRRAERSQRAAETSLQDEHAARVAAESGMLVAGKRARRARADAAHTAKRLERSKRRSRRHGKGETLLGAFGSVEPIVRNAMESAQSTSADAAERSRKAGRRARKAASRSVGRAKVAASSAKDAAAPHAASIGARAREAIDHATAHDS